MKFVAPAVLLVALGVCSAEDLKVTIPAPDAPALVLTVPHDAKVNRSKDKTEIRASGMVLYVWLITGAKTVDEGVAKISTVIASEVLEFAATKTNTITVAGTPAQHLIGRAIEADDNDPGTADVVVFTTGKTVFAACVHGEGDEASKERALMLAVLKTARTP